MSENTEMQFFAKRLTESISKYYREKVLESDFKAIFNEHRSRTGANHYIVGTNCFFEDSRISPVKAVRFGSNAVRLDKELYPQHIIWWNEYSDYARDWSRVSQTLSSIVIRAQSWQDIRDMLPNHMLQSFLQEDNFLGLSRTRPHLYAGRPGSKEYDENFITLMQHWDMQLIAMYSSIGDTISTYIGYKLL